MRTPNILAKGNVPTAVPAKAFAPIDIGVVAMSTSVSDGQLANTPLASVFPFPVSVALARAVHPAKVYSPTPYDEVVTEMSPVHPWKTFAPSDVTEAGMVTEERFLASRNALGNTFFTVEGMVND